MLRFAVFAVLLATPGVALAAIPCSDLPKADQYIHERLHTVPNTRAAERHLEAARRARSERACSSELAQADRYAKRSLAADNAAAQRRH